MMTQDERWLKAERESPPRSPEAPLIPLFRGKDEP